MAMRSPLYLDLDTLLAQADYQDIGVPPDMEVVERTSNKNTGGGNFNVPGIGSAGASRGSDVEYQSTYNLKPRLKSTVSKVIDELIRQGDLKTNPDPEIALVKDDLVEIEGLARMTAASLAGKLFFILRRIMDVSAMDINSLFDLGMEDPDLVEQFKKVYLQNELLPLPVLFQLTGTGLSQNVYVNVEPNHFIDSASADRIEGDVRVLGSVSHIVPGGEDGYISAERWLLHDWEYLMRRKMMPKVGDSVVQLVEQLEIDFPSDDVHSYISGPAIIIDAIAAY